MFKLFMYSFIFTQIACSAGKMQAVGLLFTGIIAAYFLMVRWFPVFPYHRPPPEDYNYYDGDED